MQLFPIHATGIAPQFMKFFQGFTMTGRPAHHVTLPAEPGLGTKRLQAALDAAKDAPLHLTLGAGEHLTAGLRVYSNTHLELAEGATLRFLPGYDAYAHTEVAVEAEQSNRAMIVATGAENIRISGAGRIFCEGSTAYSIGDDDVMGTRIPAALRPRVMVLDGCRNVALSGIAVEDSPMWTLHFVDCEGLRITGLCVHNDRRMPNTDGMVIDGCRDVRIEGCEIRTADDGIVLKTSDRIDGGAAAVCHDIEVRDCTIESRSCALKLGTESFADFTDISFLDCRIEKSNRALGIFSRDGGAVRGVRFENVRVDCHEAPGGFWGSGEPITITVLDRRPETRPAGDVSDVSLAGISGSAPGAINLYAERPGMIRDVRISDVTLAQTPGPLGTALCYDLRPTPTDLIPSDDAAGRVNAWRLGEDGRIIGLHDYPGGLPAVFASGVKDLTLSGVNVTRPDPLPEGWAAGPVTIERDG